MIEVYAMASDGSESSGAYVSSTSVTITCSSCKKLIYEKETRD